MFATRFCAKRDCNLYEFFVLVFEKQTISFIQYIRRRSLIGAIGLTLKSKLKAIIGEFEKIFAAAQAQIHEQDNSLAESYTRGRLLGKTTD